MGNWNYTYENISNCLRWISFALRCCISFRWFNSVLHTECILSVVIILYSFGLRVLIVIPIKSCSVVLRSNLFECFPVYANIVRFVAPLWCSRRLMRMLRNVLQSPFRRWKICAPRRAPSLVDGDAGRVVVAMDAVVVVTMR